MVKRVLRFLAVKCDRFLLVLAGTTGGLVLAQFPQFLAQYLQRVGGHVDEARYAAKLFNIPLLATRAAVLENALSQIKNSSALLKLLRFLEKAEWEIARETLKNYSPGVSFDREGIFYLIFGCLLGASLYGLVKLLLELPWVLIRKRFKSGNNTKKLENFPM